MTKPIQTLHIIMLGIFALINAVILYLFLMNLPYGIEALLASIAHWRALSPQIWLVAATAAGAGIIGAIYAWRLDSLWKNRLLYMRWQFPHPARDAFLTTRKQPFDSQALVKAFPKAKDSGFSARVQTELWRDLYRQHAADLVVQNTAIYWKMLRDLYVLSLFFLFLFATTWLINRSLPFAVTSVYVFMYGTQFLFLLLTARRLGRKLVDNVLAVALGETSREV